MFKLFKNKIQTGDNTANPDLAAPSGKTPPDASGEPAAKAALKRPEVDINSYKDPEGLTLGKMKFGLWVVVHRRELLAVPSIALIIFSAITWAFSVYHLGYYFVKGRNEDRKLVNELTQTIMVGHDFFLERSARNLEYSPVQIFEADENGRYDFLVKIHNPNAGHYGMFSFSFLTGNNESERQEGFILPSETKYIYALGQNLVNKPELARLNLYNSGWQRIDRHAYPDWNNFQAERLNFKVDGIEFLPAKATILSEKLNLNDLRFSVTNQSAFNFYEIKLAVLPTRQGEIIGVNAYGINKFLSGEKRELRVTWPGRLGRVDGVIVLPELDITKNDIYMKFSGDNLTGADNNE